MFSGGDVSPKVRTALLDALNPTAKKLSVETLDPTPIKNLSDIEDGEALVHYQTIEETPGCYDPKFEVPLDTVLKDPVTIKLIPAGSDLGNKKDSYITVSSKKPIESGSNLERYVQDVPTDNPTLYQNLQASFFAANMSEVIKKYSKTANESPESFALAVKTGEVEIYNGVCRNNQPNSTTKEVEVYFHKGNKVLNRHETNGLKPVDLPKGFYLQDFDKIQILVECQYGDRESAFDGDGKLFLPLNLDKADKCKETIAKLFGENTPMTLAINDAIDQTVDQLRTEWHMKVSQFAGSFTFPVIQIIMMVTLIRAQKPMIALAKMNLDAEQKQKAPILPRLQELVDLARKGEIIRPSSHMNGLVYKIVPMIDLGRQFPIVTSEFAGQGKSLALNAIAYVIADGKMPDGQPLAQFAPYVANAPILPQLNPRDISATERGSYVGAMSREFGKYVSEVKAVNGIAAMDEFADFQTVGKSTGSEGVINDIKAESGVHGVGTAVEADYKKAVGPQIARRFPQVRGEDYGLVLNVAQTIEALKEDDKPGKPRLFHQKKLGRTITNGAIDRIVAIANAQPDNGESLISRATNLMYVIGADMNGQGIEIADPTDPSKKIPAPMTEAHVDAYLEESAKSNIRTVANKVVSDKEAEQRGLSPEMIAASQWGSIYSYCQDHVTGFKDLPKETKDAIVEGMFKIWNNVTEQTRTLERIKTGTPEHQVPETFIKMALGMVDEARWLALKNPPEEVRPDRGPRNPGGPTGGGGTPPVGGAPAGGGAPAAGGAPATGPTAAPAPAPENVVERNAIVLEKRRNLVLRLIETPANVALTSVPFSWWAMMAHPDIGWISKTTHDLGIATFLAASTVLDITTVPSLAILAYPFKWGSALTVQALDKLGEKTGIPGLQKESLISTGAAVVGGFVGAAVASNEYSVVRNYGVQFLQNQGMLQGAASQLRGAQAIHELSQLSLRPFGFALRGMGHGPALHYLGQLQSNLRQDIAHKIFQVARAGVGQAVQAVRAVEVGVMQRKAALAGATAGAGGISSFARVALPVARALLSGASAASSASAVAATATTAAVETVAVTTATTAVTTSAAVSAGTLVISGLAVAGAGAAGYGVGTAGMNALDNFAQEKRLGSAMDIGSYEIPQEAPDKYKRGNWKFSADE